uniref:Nucleoporinlike protein putative n=1 Tax=Albugo laibachii Nc14 TaxID=890382 RepID=F0W8H2_9STRA|nr:nucleoporinlike protein putative [Albugo laibachii Nc14]|eukprot:CCA17427.1 nucleoporinlike protein putative [Albugo laibachii Nc14]
MVELTIVARVSKLPLRLSPDENDTPVLLLWDDFSGHWTGEVTELATTLRVVLEHPFNSRLRRAWVDHITESVEADSRPYLYRPPSRERVIEWVAEAWSGLSKETIQSGFVRAKFPAEGRRVVAEELDSDNVAEILESLCLIETNVSDLEPDDDLSCVEASEADGKGAKGSGGEDVDVITGRNDHRPLFQSDTIPDQSIDTMKIMRRFQSHHSDFIHDMSFDLYGKRLATCSSDRKIKIWTLRFKRCKQGTCDNSEWVLDSEWSAHQASVWKVTWAHPEFGQIIASCSFDRTVSIWEDQGVLHHRQADSQTSLEAAGNLIGSSVEGTFPSCVPSGGSYNASGIRESWRNQAQLVDSRESVHDVKFAPRHLGLRLATASGDGFVRMYEAIDVVNLSHWPLQEEFLADRDGATCISWNQSRIDPPTIVVGGNSNIVKVWGYSNAFRRWQAVVELQGHNDAIHDVCWAPNMGRSFHLVATASKDRVVRIWELRFKSDGTIGDVPNASTGTLSTTAVSSNAGGNSQLPRCTVKLVASKHHHDAEVWRVEWNVTGTMLASSGDDGTVHMWKCDCDGNWVCISTIAGDLEPFPPPRTQPNPQDASI